MQVVHGTEQHRGLSAPVLTIGNFDGVHVGHQALIGLTVTLAREVGAPAAAMTFHPAPRDVLRPDNGIPHIQRLDQKLRSLEAAGIDRVVVEPFSPEMAMRSAEDFADTVLHDRLHVCGLALGHDFRFGRGRSGTIDTLRKRFDLPIRQVEPVLVQGRPVSSSRIRGCLLAGDVADAAILLGRPHVVEGEVIHGEGRGRQLGFATANIAVAAGMMPLQGVYAVRVALDEHRLPGVANLGTRPTFDGTGQVLEVHLLDWHGDLYDRHLTVSFIERIRGERRFDGVDALVAAVSEDIAAARVVLE